MNKDYKELFQLIARNGAINTEVVMDTFNKDGKEKHEKELALVTSTRDTYNALEDKISNDGPLDYKDYVTLAAGAVVSRNIIQRNIETWSAVVREYDENLIPKLNEVVAEKDDEKRATLIQDFFD